MGTPSRRWEMRGGGSAQSGIRTVFGVAVTPTPDQGNRHSGCGGTASSNARIARTGSRRRRQQAEGGPLDIQLLHFEGCPNWETASANLRAALDQVGPVTWSFAIGW